MSDKHVVLTINDNVVYDSDVENDDMVDPVDYTDLLHTKYIRDEDDTIHHAEDIILVIRESDGRTWINNNEDHTSFRLSTVGKFKEVATICRKASIDDTF